MYQTRIGMLVATIVCLLALSFHIAAQTQNPKPQEPEDVVQVFSDLVQTDVMVFDKQGRFVNGLKREDFELKIDGKRKPVEFFDHIAAGTNNEQAQLSAAGGTTAANQRTDRSRPLPLDRGRTVFFYLDDFHMSPGSLLQTRKLLLRFIEHSLGQNDMAAITSASGSVGFLQQLSDNKAVLRAAVARLTTRSFVFRDQRPGISEYQALQIDRNDPDLIGYFVDLISRETGAPRNERNTIEQEVRGRARQILAEAESISISTLAGLESLVRSSGRLPGRKLVMLISDGFFFDTRNSDTLDRLRRITSAAARSGVVIYSMDARGLVASFQDDSTVVLPDDTGRLARGSNGEFLALQDGMNALAKDTGGRTIFNTNALDVALSNALKETSVYYLLAWRPEHEAAASERFRKISVTLVGHPDLTVRVRQGFFDREPPVVDRKNQTHTDKVADKTERIQAAAVLRDSLRDVYPKTELPVVVNVGVLNIPPMGMMLTISMLMTMDSLAFANEGVKLKGVMDVRGGVYNDKGNVGGSFADSLTITVPSVEALRRANREFIYNYQVFLPAGLYQVRVGARDPASGKVGAAYEWIEVPNLATHGLTLSSIFSGERQPASAAEPNISPGMGPAAPRVDHCFHRNSVLRFVVYVYNSALSPSDSKPDLGVQVQVLRDQEPVITTPSKKITGEGIKSMDRLPYAGDLSLEGLAPGRYMLRISVVDRIAKTSATRQMRFDIQ